MTGPTHTPMSATATLTLITEYPTARDLPVGDDEHEYLLRFWLPIIGPTPVICRQVVLLELEHHGRPTANGTHPIYLVTRRDAAQLARACGVGVDTLDNNLWRALRHGFWHHDDDQHGDCVWTIPWALPLVPDRIIGRRRPPFADEHTAFLARFARTADTAR